MWMQGRKGEYTAVLPRVSSPNKKLRSGDFSESHKDQRCSRSRLSQTLAEALRRKAQDGDAKDEQDRSLIPQLGQGGALQK
jgi:hypothetical protein